MAITYYLSGGNLFAPSLIHGAYDAAAFVGVATTQGTGMLLRWLMIVIGLVAGLVLVLEKVRKKSNPPPDRIAREGAISLVFRISYNRPHRFRSALHKQDIASCLERAAILLKRVLPV